MIKKLWMYWETIDYRPAYIDLCLATVRHHAPGWDIIIVTPETANKYLPNLRSDFAKIPEVAHKADYLRANLLNEHGGCWIDSDAILLLDLSTFIESNINDKTAMFYARHPRCPSISFIYSEPHNKLISKWASEIDEKLDNSLIQPWEGIGHHILWGLIHTGLNEYTEINHMCCAPIAWQDIPIKLPADIPIENIVDNTTVMVQINNKMLKPVMGEWTKDQILNSDTLLARLFKKSNADIS